MSKGKLLDQPLTVAELFAGVGGFRLGLEGGAGKERNPNYQIIWSNQWEPSTKKQHASLVYESRFGSQGHSSEDIAAVKAHQIPDHDLLVGGFPCQDYSVATTLNNSGGIIGKKGVLWWQIHRILHEKGENRPKYLFLENVDRLLKSPAQQRGRDFAIMLSSLYRLGYGVEWRVINAADYGMPQRRRRVFILAYHESTEMYQKMQNAGGEGWIGSEGVLSQAFPIQESTGSASLFRVLKDVKRVSDEFNKGGPVSPFENAGVMFKGKVMTDRVTPFFKGPFQTLGSILQPDKEISSSFYLDEELLEKWQYLKGAKKETRRTSAGYEYLYSEGGMTFPDALDKPSRTVITGEGGGTPSRFKHVVKTAGGYRRLTPVELERLNMFPDNHTRLEGISDSKRAFFMGNALVVGVVERIGDRLAQAIADSTPVLTEK